MTTEIPWIGYNEGMKYQNRALREAGFDVEIARDMKSGLTLLQKTSYPVVIVQDWLLPRELELPPKVSTHDPIEIIHYFLTQIRELSDYKQKPIIIPHYLSEENDNLKRLQIDNSIELVDMLHAKSITGCIVDAVRRHL